MAVQVLIVVEAPPVAVPPVAEVLPPVPMLEVPPLVDEPPVDDLPPVALEPPADIAPPVTTALELVPPVALLPPEVAFPPTGLVAATVVDPPLTAEAALLDELIPPAAVDVEALDAPPLPQAPPVEPIVPSGSAPLQARIEKAVPRAVICSDLTDNAASDWIESSFAPPIPAERDCDRPDAPKTPKAFPVRKPA